MLRPRKSDCPRFATRLSLGRGLGGTQSPRQVVERRALWGYDAVESGVAGAEGLGEEYLAHGRARQPSVPAESPEVPAFAQGALGLWRCIDPTTVLAACSRVELLRM